MGTESGPSETSDEETGVVGTTAPTACVVGNETYEIGEQWQGDNGCTTYACEVGDVVVVETLLVSASGDLLLSTQELVEAQRCLQTVQGTLTINGTAANLEPLANLANVSGALNITDSAAVTLVGLGSLNEIGTGLTIANNTQLTQLAFNPLMNVYGDVVIENNDVMPSLAGAAFIGQCATCLGGDGDEEPPGGDGGAEEGGAPEPTGADVGSATGDGGGSFYGKILIAENDILTDVSALSGLRYAWDDVRFRNNASLESLVSMQLIDVEGDLEITGHASMPTAAANAFADGVTVFGARLVCGNLDGPACP